MEKLIKTEIHFNYMVKCYLVGELKHFAHSTLKIVTRCVITQRYRTQVVKRRIQRVKGSNDYVFSYNHNRIIVSDLDKILEDAI